MTVLLDAPSGNWPGRFVSFRWGERAAGALVVPGVVCDVPASGGVTSGAWRWIKLCGLGACIVSAASTSELMATTQSVAVTKAKRWMLEWTGVTKSVFRRRWPRRQSWLGTMPGEHA